MNQGYRDAASGAGTGTGTVEAKLLEPISGSPSSPALEESPVDSPHSRKEKVPVDFGTGHTQVSHLSKGPVA